MKELKCFTSHNNYFPQTYLESSLISDSKAIGVDGERLKVIKKIVEDDLLSLTEDSIDSEARTAIRNEVSTKVYKNLGYYECEKSPDFSPTKDLTIRTKRFTIPVETQIRFRGGDQLWLLKHQPEMSFAIAEKSAEDAFDRKSDLFIDEPFQVSFKNEVTAVPFRDVIEAIFDGDQTNCEFLIVSSGSDLFLLERGKWQEGPHSFLKLSLKELFCDINAKDYYVMAEALFSPKAFPIDSADNFHDTLNRNSHKKASEVTKALRETVRESIEIIADEILSQHATRPLSVWKTRDLTKSIDRQVCAEEIFDQTLKFIYRMLFMLFTESQDQAKGALPVQSRTYQMGYSIEKLRDLEVKALLNSKVQEGSGNFIHQTLNRSFEVYFQGYGRDFIQSKNALGFTFPSLGTKLFSPQSTAIFNEVTLPDTIMQQILRKLSLAKIGTGKKAKTHRVHYAGLGLNQLGAVYEGLLTLKPEILSEKVSLLAKDVKDSAHKYVSFSKSSEIKDKDLARDEDKKLITKNKGSFLLSPVGLERKFSASFYTPEILTRFLAKETVDALLGIEPTLEKMENLRILEPAMGSGAFLNAVVDEIAPRMAKLYEIPDKTSFQEAMDNLRNVNYTHSASEFNKVSQLKPKDFSFYLSKAKNHLMTNCIFGIDLNPTAVDLAKVSIWLNCLHEEMNLPFLDLKLRLGNSLVGAWINRCKNERTNLPLWFFPNGKALAPHTDGKILGDKKRPLIDDQEMLEKLHRLGVEWNSIEKNIEKFKLDDLAKNVEELYRKHNECKQKFLSRIRDINESTAKDRLYADYVEENVHYNQLRTMMDLWCSLWFWPADRLSQLPNAESYVGAMDWISKNELSYGPIQSQQLKRCPYPFLSTVREIALQAKFFHYDLEFSEIFEQDGGFDLVLGNPPWALVKWEEKDFFEIESPGLDEIGGDSKDKHKRYDRILRTSSEVLSKYRVAKARSEGFSNFLKHSNTYPFEDHSKTNTYRYFYQRFFQATKEGGIHGMIAQDGIISDDGCAKLRPDFISELLKIYRFVNGIKLFEDIGHLVSYMVWISKRGKAEIGFQLIDNLYHPLTVQKCADELESTPYRGMKDDEGNWELRGHPDRIINVSSPVLNVLSKFDEATENAFVLPTIHGAYELEILTKMAKHPKKMCHTTWDLWGRFDEAAAPKAGLIKRDPRQSHSIAHAVLTGPNIFVAHPARKIPNPGCKSKGDFSETDLNDRNSCPDNFFPDTVFQATEKGIKSAEYLAVTSWGEIMSRKYRIFSRRMVSTTGERTFSSCIIPPGPTHVHTISSLAFQSDDELVFTSGLFHSLIFDFLTRTLSGGDIVKSIYNMLPTLTEFQLNDKRLSKLIPHLKVRTLRLNLISNRYQSLWETQFINEFKDCDVLSSHSPNLPYSRLSKTWTRDTCIRERHQRDQALSEIDAIVALLFGFEKSTLLNLYRSQFGVLQINFQDLPNQSVNKDSYYFPRYEVMGKAYDNFEKLIAIAPTAPPTKVAKMQKMVG